MELSQIKRRRFIFIAMPLMVFLGTVAMKLLHKEETFINLLLFIIIPATLPLGIWWVVQKIRKQPF